MKILAFKEEFDLFTCWSDLDTRQSYGLLIQSGGSTLKFSFEAMRIAFDHGIFEIMEEAA